ncbi:hypothetical protein NP493_1165g01029 [Ridgeia piscesae]|uniref:Apple domain-containing protein n=1 Tax=Ridgeia piscesae TaxID=27915 RepID=A0AAD9KE98_RIDPI|nr:hypothetical protein NP493_1165g01029 [Ridgeia piscesae]
MNNGSCFIDGGLDDMNHYVAERYCDCAIGYDGDLCEDCVGKFEDKRDMGLNNTGYDSSVEKSLADCQRTCLVEYPFCVAVDYTEGQCIMFNIKQYRSMTLIKNVGNVHSIINPCTDGS